MGDAPYLRIAEVRARLAAAGYPDSDDTIRRAVDRGTYGVQGQDWYRSESGYRYVSSSAVDAVIARRRAGPAG